MGICVSSFARCCYSCCPSEINPWQPTYTDIDLPKLPPTAYEYVKNAWRKQYPQVLPLVGFGNFCETVELKDSIVFQLTTTAQISSLLKIIYAYNENKSLTEKLLVRVAAGRNNPSLHDDDPTTPMKGAELNYDHYSYSYSLTPCAMGHIIIRLVGDEFFSVKATSVANQVAVGPNLPIGRFEEILWENFNMILPTTSLIPYVTFVGITSNAGHGTGKNQGALAGLIRAIKLILPNGEETIIKSTDPNWAAVIGANLGGFGVIVSAIVECCPRQKLSYVKTPVNYATLLTEVDGGLFTNNDYASVMYMPTYAKDEFDVSGPNNVQLVTGHLVPDDQPDVNNDEFERRFGQYALQAGIGFFDLFSLPFILAAHPLLIPYVMEVMAFVEIQSSGDEPYPTVGPFYQISHYTTAYPWALDDIDVIIPIPDTQPQLIRKALEFIQTKIKEYSDKNEYTIIDAMYLRYIKGTPGGLSTSQVIPGTSQVKQENTHFLCLDIVSNLKVKGYPDFKAEVQTYLIDEMKGKVHWGKSVPVDQDYTKMYGIKMDEYKQALTDYAKMAGFDDLNSSPFVNPFLSMIVNGVVSSTPDKTGRLEGSPRLITPAAIQTATDDLIEKLSNHMKDWKLGEFKTTQPSKPVAGTVPTPETHLLTAAGVPLSPHCVHPQHAPPEAIDKAAAHSKEMNRRRRLKHSRLVATAGVAPSSLHSSALSSSSPHIGAAGEEPVRAFEEVEGKLQNLLEKLRECKGQPMSVR